jgi:HEAT repeat protein
MKLAKSHNVEIRRLAIHALGAIGGAAEEAVPSLGDVLLQDPDRGARIEAALALIKMSPASRTALPALIQALEDHDPMIRMDAALALLRLGKEARPAIPNLIRALANERNQTNCEQFSYTIQEMAAAALGRASAGTAEAVPALAAFLSSSDRVETREVAARALGEVGPEARSATPQLRALLQDRSEMVRQAATEALRKIVEDWCPGDEEEDD